MTVNQRKDPVPATTGAEIHAVLPAVKGTGTGRVIAHFAWQHLKSATIFRDKLKELEATYAGQPHGDHFPEIRAYASASIMAATASLECLINEAFISWTGKLRRSFDDFERDFWSNKGIEKKRTLVKYQIALRKLGHRELDATCRAYSDVFGLIELRNKLIHHKPSWDGDRQRDIDLLEMIGGRFDFSPFAPQGSDFVTSACMSASCASWGIASVLAFLRLFDEASQHEAEIIDAFWSLEDSTTVGQS